MVGLPSRTWLDHGWSGPGLANRRGRARGGDGPEGVNGLNVQAEGELVDSDREAAHTSGTVHSDSATVWMTFSHQWPLRSALAACRQYGFEVADCSTILGTLD